MKKDFQDESLFRYATTPTRNEVRPIPGGVVGMRYRLIWVCEYALAHSTWSEAQTGHICKMQRLAHTRRQCLDEVQPSFPADILTRRASQRAYALVLGGFYRIKFLGKAWNYLGLAIGRTGSGRDLSVVWRWIKFEVMAGSVAAYWALSVSVCGLACFLRQLAYYVNRILKF